MSGESMTNEVIRKLNARSKLLHQKYEYLTLKLCRLLYNTFIQPHFDYGCSVWYPNLSKK